MGTVVPAAAARRRDRRRDSIASSALVLGQTAACIVVLVCGGLFVRSLQQLAAFDLGFRTERLLMASVDLGLPGYDQDRGRQFLDQLTERVGLVLGLTASVALARLLAALLYGLNPVNVPVFTAVAVLVLGASLLACWLPARRAAGVDPTVALRYE